jgi:hypothetical protein
LRSGEGAGGERAGTEEGRGGGGASAQVHSRDRAGPWQRPRACAPAYAEAPTQGAGRAARPAFIPRSVIWPRIRWRHPARGGRPHRRGFGRAFGGVRRGVQLHCRPPHTLGCAGGEQLAWRLGEAAAARKVRRLQPPQLAATAGSRVLQPSASAAQRCSAWSSPHVLPVRRRRRPGGGGEEGCRGLAAGAAAQLCRTQPPQHHCSRCRARFGRAAAPQNRRVLCTLGAHLEQAGRAVTAKIIIALAAVCRRGASLCMKAWLMRTTFNTALPLKRGRRRHCRYSRHRQNTGSARASTRHGRGGRRRCASFAQYLGIVRAPAECRSLQAAWGGACRPHGTAAPCGGARLAVLSQSSWRHTSSVSRH